MDELKKHIADLRSRYGDSWLPASDVLAICIRTLVMIEGLEKRMKAVEHEVIKGA